MVVCAQREHFARRTLRPSSPSSLARIAIADAAQPPPTQSIGVFLIFLEPQMLRRAQAPANQCGLGAPEPGNLGMGVGLDQQPTTEKLRRCGGMWQRAFAARAIRQCGTVGRHHLGYSIWRCFVANRPISAPGYPHSLSFACRNVAFMRIRAFHNFMSHYVFSSDYSMSLGCGSGSGQGIYRTSLRNFCAL